MADAVTRLVVDCSVVVKWKIPSDNHAAAAEELLLDWEHDAVEVWAPFHLQEEVVSTFLRAHRRGRITEEEAREAIRDLLPYRLCSANWQRWPIMPSVSHNSTTNERMIASTSRWRMMPGCLSGPATNGCTMRCTSIVTVCAGSGPISDNARRTRRRPHPETSARCGVPPYPSR